MAITLTPTRPTTRVAAIVLGNPGGRGAEISEALSRYGFRHTVSMSPESALREAERATAALLVMSAADALAVPELAASAPGRRAVVIAGPGCDRNALPESIAAILEDDEAASIEALAETFQSVAREVSYSRRRDTMLRWLEREAERDATTGLCTRAAFESTLAAICDDAAKSGDTVCTIVVHIPVVRSVQETHGREAASELLHRAALAVSRSIRMTDVAGRLSTDTFGIALPGASLDTGRRIARRILQWVEQEDGEVEPELAIVLGFGVAAGSHCSGAELLEAANSQVAQAHRSYAGTRWRAEDTEGPSVA